MNQIKASLIFGTALIVLGASLMAWHRAVRDRHSDENTGNDRERRHFRLQFRRRVQVSALLILLGFMIPGGDWLIEAQRKNPNRSAAAWITAYWLAVLLCALWVIALAILDWFSTRMHVRATRSALAGLDRKRRELQAELDRLRNEQSNGRR